VRTFLLSSSSTWSNSRGRLSDADFQGGEGIGLSCCSDSCVCVSSFSDCFLDSGGGIVSVSDSSDSTRVSSQRAGARTYGADLLGGEYLSSEESGSMKQQRIAPLPLPICPSCAFGTNNTATVHPISPMLMMKKKKKERDMRRISGVPLWHSGFPSLHPNSICVRVVRADLHLYLPLIAVFSYEKGDGLTFFVYSG